MGWVTHHCERPASGDRGQIPEGHEPGDFWRCTVDGCGKLWRINGGMLAWLWQEASPKECKRHKDKGWD